MLATVTTSPVSTHLSFVNKATAYVDNESFSSDRVFSSNSGDASSAWSGNIAHSHEQLNTLLALLIKQLNSGCLQIRQNEIPQFWGFPHTLNNLFHTIIKLKPDATNHISRHFGTFRNDVRWWRRFDRHCRLFTWSIFILWNYSQIFQCQFALFCGHTVVSWIFYTSLMTTFPEYTVVPHYIELG